MKQGRTLTDLAAELQRQRDAKRDFVADTRVLTLSPVRRETSIGTQLSYELSIPNDDTLEAFQVDNLCHRQVGTKAKIPAKYYDRMRQEAPELLVDNVHHWWRQHPQRRMVRTLDNRARAFLSDRYRRIDNYAMAEVALPALTKAGAEVVSCEVTEHYLYLKAVFHSIQAKLNTRRQVGEVVESGVVLQNSEVGLGSYKVLPMVNILYCLNGMVMQKQGLTGRHVGRHTGRSDEAAYELYEDDTLKADDRAVMLKVRDMVRACADKAKFETIVGKMERAANTDEMKAPAATLELVKEHVGLLEREKDGVLQHLIKGGDLSLWGMSNAITRFSQDVDDYQRATELETIGGDIIEMKPRQWNGLIERAAA